ncbi:MAG: MBL fold metallo-hydrolase [Lachnospiraceae bacterium]|nr:MBL fold metallo-hydrolase [Lachnospiraceae bacterium]
MKIINLIEDTTADNGCLYEHGLSFYIETKKHKLLVDTGASDAFLQNAKKLGVDIRQVDTVVLSHGHYDHSGGILAFVKENPDAKIYIRDNAFGKFYHGKGEDKRYIGVDRRIAELSQVVMVSDNLQIDDELFLFTNVKGRKLWPSGNLQLFCIENGLASVDDYAHEQYLVISDEDKKILVSGCAHNGMLNILDEYSKVIGGQPDMVISGFHMMKKQGFTAEDVAIIKETAQELSKTSTKFYTCHCTGVDAYDMMKEIMREQVDFIHSGEVVYRS